MGRRQSIEIPGVNHGSTPIPQGAKLDGIVFSSAISGADPETGKIPEDPERQVQLAFANVRRFMEICGGTTEDIGRVTVYLAEERYRDLVNVEWVKMFPDASNRPARHSIVSQLRGGAVVQLELIAVLNSDER
ncbi:RidA family protein [Alicyclobacillus kakegawensis]|uniref:RidA family protein n=1 Tax=Alicyclobacillus kakegawensis TaxID=392012 RepID=UPI00082D04CC|nr:RidA family protein [Alicyclobacillus kakegawensis]